MGAETGERDLYNDCGSYKERDPLGNPRNNKAFIRLHAVQRLVMHKIDIEIMRAQVSPARYLPFAINRRLVPSRPPVRRLQTEILRQRHNPIHRSISRETLWNKSRTGATSVPDGRDIQTTESYGSIIPRRFGSECPTKTNGSVHLRLRDKPWGRSLCAQV